jgi:hypothetical protein
MKEKLEALLPLLHSAGLVIQAFELGAASSKDCWKAISLIDSIIGEIEMEFRDLNERFVSIKNQVNILKEITRKICRKMN